MSWFFAENYFIDFVSQKNCLCRKQEQILHQGQWKQQPFLHGLCSSLHSTQNESLLHSMFRCKKEHSSSPQCNWSHSWVVYKFPVSIWVLKSESSGYCWRLPLHIGGGCWFWNQVPSCFIKVAKRRRSCCTDSFRRGNCIVIWGYKFPLLHCWCWCWWWWWWFWRYGCCEGVS